ncbi:hypothetical protein POM88_035145 [Heracleum sosnowskyi]|uniref:Pentatricopeptide repeat-containing protein n=1 Tax=Heracleum sosnowskyi TaxID=360622 RepID=A0AAD8HLQ7_9APIA|nr:hypothetical protein POM88_035145 [Heracleum sosnowskyi]
MLEGGLKLDSFTYKELIHGFCRKLEMDSVQELLFSMQSAGFSPSYCTYSWLVDGYRNQEEGTFGDTVVLTSMAYAYLKVGNQVAAISFLDEMYKRRLMVTLKIYKSLSASYASDKGILDIFWDLVFNKNLVLKGLIKDIKQLNL